ncbi:hypothetical protein PV325_009485, partial [Microctonus aethiopoides]
MKYREWAMVRRDDLYSILPSNCLYIKTNAEWTQLDNDHDVDHGELLSRSSQPKMPQDSYTFIAFANSSEELWDTAKILGASDKNIEVINQSNQKERPEVTSFFFQNFIENDVLIIKTLPLCISALQENPTPQNRAIECNNMIDK